MSADAIDLGPLLFGAVYLGREDRLPRRRLWLKGALCFEVEPERSVKVCRVASLSVERMTGDRPSFARILVTDAFGSSSDHIVEHPDGEPGLMRAMREWLGAEP